MELLLLALLGGGLVWYFGSSDASADDSVPSFATVVKYNGVDVQAYPESDPAHLTQAIDQYFVEKKDVDAATGVVAFTLTPEKFGQSFKDALTAHMMSVAAAGGSTDSVIIARTRDVNVFAKGGKPNPWMLYLYPSKDGAAVASPGSKYLILEGD
jgi:hypothetical protein